MLRINANFTESATGKAKELLDIVHRKFGMVPNMMREMAKAPATLDGYLQLSGALSQSSLSSKLREQISLAVAEANGCEYCLAAHSSIGRMVGLTPDQIRDSRLGTAVDPKTDALLRFVHKIVDARGRVSDDDIQDVRDVGFDDSVITEVVASVALDIFTNYFNLVAGTEIDFPKVSALQPELTSAS